MKLVDEIKNLKLLKDETVQLIETTNKEKDKEVSDIIYDIAKQKYIDKVHPILDKIDKIKGRGNTLNIIFKLLAIILFLVAGGALIGGCLNGCGIWSTLGTKSDGSKYSIGFLVCLGVALLGGVAGIVLFIIPFDSISGLKTELSKIEGFNVDLITNDFKSSEYRDYSSHQKLYSLEEQSILHDEYKVKINYLEKNRLLAKISKKVIEKSEISRKKQEEYEAKCDEIGITDQFKYNDMFFETVISLCEENPKIQNLYDIVQLLLKLYSESAPSKFLDRLEKSKDFDAMIAEANKLFKAKYIPNLF